VMLWDGLERSTKCLPIGRYDDSNILLSSERFREMGGTEVLKYYPIYVAESASSIASTAATSTSTSTSSTTHTIQPILPRKRSYYEHLSQLSMQSSETIAKQIAIRYANGVAAVARGVAEVAAEASSASADPDGGAAVDDTNKRYMLADNGIIRSNSVPFFPMSCFRNDYT
jgi:hypothetical protein